MQYGSVQSFRSCRIATKEYGLLFNLTWGKERNIRALSGRAMATPRKIAVKRYANCILVGLRNRLEDSEWVLQET